MKMHIQFSLLVLEKKLNAFLVHKIQNGKPQMTAAFIHIHTFIQSLSKNIINAHMSVRVEYCKPIMPAWRSAIIMD